MIKEALIQVAADGVGKKVRNLSAYVVQPDESVALVHMQVVALVDETGKPINLDLQSALEELLWVARQQRFLLRLIADSTLRAGRSLTDDDISLAGELIL